MFGVVAMNSRSMLNIVKRIILLLLFFKIDQLCI
jgi:hypothetical protein